MTMATTMAAARRATGYDDYGDDDGSCATGNNEVDGDGATGDNNDGQQR
jgi:hypothetical protein